MIAERREPVVTPVHHVRKLVYVGALCETPSQGLTKRGNVTPKSIKPCDVHSTDKRQELITNEEIAAKDALYQANINAERAHKDARIRIANRCDAVVCLRKRSNDSLCHPIRVLGLGKACRINGLHKNVDDF